MSQPKPKIILPPIPQKRYFSIGEVSTLCAAKPHVLRYWEQEFTQLRPTKRRGNRRYYQFKDVMLIRQIRSLLYEQGFTIGGARLKLVQLQQEENQSEKSHPLSYLIEESLLELDALVADLDAIHESE